VRILWSGVWSTRNAVSPPSLHKEAQPPQESRCKLNNPALVEFQDSIDFVFIGKMTAEEFHANADELLKNGIEANAQSSREEYETRDARLAELRAMVETTN